MNKSNIKELSSQTEVDSIPTTQNPSVSQPNANTNVVGSLSGQREITFRAWDGEKMHEGIVPWHWDFVISLSWHRCEKSTGNGILGSGGKTAEMLVPAIHYEKIMQYTGLKDKNGKEIYEGDIISYFCLKRYVQQSFIDVSPEIDELYLKKQISSVIFHKGCFILKEWEEDDMYMPISEIGLYNIDEIKDMVFGDDRKKVFSEEEMFCDCNGNEINEDKIGIIKIGNVFENPELLQTLR